jgi:hypothetical protein
MSIGTTQFPNLEKMQAMQAKSQPIGEFIDWLGQNGMAICTSDGGPRGDRFTPVMASTEELLARHFNVDLKAAEKERRAVLATLSQSY